MAACALKALRSTCAAARLVSAAMHGLAAGLRGNVQPSGGPKHQQM